MPERHCLCLLDSLLHFIDFGAEARFELWNELRADEFLPEKLIMYVLFIFQILDNLSKLVRSLERISGDLDHFNQLSFSGVYLLMQVSECFVKLLIFAIPWLDFLI